MKFIVGAFLFLISLNVFAAQEYQFDCVIRDDLYDSDFDMKVAFWLDAQNAKCTILVASLVLPCERKESKDERGYTFIT